MIQIFLMIDLTKDEEPKPPAVDSAREPVMSIQNEIKMPKL